MKHKNKSWCISTSQETVDKVKKYTQENLMSISKFVTAAINEKIERDSKNGR